MSIADSYDGFLIDLDGVVWIGDRAVEGSVEAANRLMAAGKRLAFVTNSPRQSRAAQSESLRELGIGMEDDQLITSALVTFELALERAGRGGSALVIGTPSFHRQAADAGLEALGPDRAGEAAVVVVSGHDRFDYAELRAAAMAVRAGAPLLATGRDPTMPMPDGLWPGTGSILAAIETASGGRAEIGGKPERALFEAGLKAIGKPEKVAMVGDRLDTDIAGAQAAGVDGILVMSGSTGERELRDSEVSPDRVIERLDSLLG